MGEIRTTYSVATKYAAIELYLQGMNPYTISEAMNIGRSIIQRWVQHYEREGMAGLEDKRGHSKGAPKGPPRKSSPFANEQNQKWERM